VQFCQSAYMYPLLLLLLLLEVVAMHLVELGEGVGA
jgi:hypothetical protein